MFIFLHVNTAIAYALIKFQFQQYPQGEIPTVSCLIYS